MLSAKNNSEFPFCETFDILLFCLISRKANISVRIFHGIYIHVVFFIIILATFSKAFKSLPSRLDLNWLLQKRHGFVFLGCRTGREQGCVTDFLLTH